VSLLPLIYKLSPLRPTQQRESCSSSSNYSFRSRPHKPSPSVPSKGNDFWWRAFDFHHPAPSRSSRFSSQQCLFVSLSPSPPPSPLMYLSYASTKSAIPSLSVIAGVIQSLRLKEGLRRESRAFSIMTKICPKIWRPGLTPPVVTRSTADPCLPKYDFLNS